MSDVLPPFWDPTTGPPLVDPVAVTPTVADVALLERTRTIGSGGADIGTFDATTHPTDAEVELLIDEALDVTLAALPDHIDVAYYTAISRLVAIRAAMSVEISYYREQAPSAWGERYDADLAALKAAVSPATWIG